MGPRHGVRHWENDALVEGAKQSINDLTRIMAEYGDYVGGDDTGSHHVPQSRRTRMRNWWKSLHWEQRQAILGIQIKEQGRQTEPMLVALLPAWLGDPGEVDNFLHFICGFEGKRARKSKDFAGGRGRLSLADPSIIGRWSAEQLYRYLKPGQRYSVSADERIPDEDALDDEMGYGDVTPEFRGGGERPTMDESWDDDKPPEMGGPKLARGPLDPEWSDEDKDPGGPDRHGVARGRRIGGTVGRAPFPIYNYYYFDKEEDEDEWEAELREREAKSTGDEPEYDKRHNLHLSKWEMEDILGQSKFAAKIMENLAPVNAMKMLRDRRDHLAKEETARGDKFSAESRKSGISPKTMSIAIELLGFTQTKDGMRYMSLLNALYDDNGEFKKINPEHILESGVGKAAITNLLHGAEKPRIEAGQEIRKEPCRKCGGSKIGYRRGRKAYTGEPPKCFECLDPVTGLSTGEQTAYRSVDASPEQKAEAVQRLQKEYDDLRHYFITPIREQAIKAGFADKCHSCNGSGKDEFLPKEDCLDCDGYGEKVRLNPFLYSINERVMKGFSSEEATDAAIKEAERRHSILNYRERKNLQEKKIAELEKFGILPNGIHALLYMNKLHAEGAVLERPNLEKMRKETIEENPDAGFHTIKNKMASKLAKAFGYIQKRVPYHGLSLRDAMHSPYIDGLLDIMATKPHLGPSAPEVISERLKNYLKPINSLAKFDESPPFRTCTACEGTRKQQDYTTATFVEGSSCPKCEVSEHLGGNNFASRSTGLERIPRGHIVPRVLDEPLLRTGVPPCPCCGDGVNQMVNSPGGLGMRMRMYHNPIDVDFDSLVVLENLWGLSAKLEGLQRRYGQDPGNEGLRHRIIQVNEAIEDAIVGEAPILNKALKMSWEQAEATSGKTGRSMEALIGGVSEDKEDFRDYGVSTLHEESTLANTKCPFCAEAKKMGDEVMWPNETKYLGDKDGYHAAKGFTKQAQGCPNDPHRDSGSEIFTHMTELEHMPDDMRDLVQKSWARGPVIDDLRRKYRRFTQHTPEQVQSWMERNPGKDKEDFHREKTEKNRDRQVYSLRPTQTVSDLVFNRFCALRRRGDRPTPDEKIDHKYQSRYLNTGLVNSTRGYYDNTLTHDKHLTESQRENYTKGERFLDKIEGGNILNFKDGKSRNEEELKRLFAIHVLIPDYLGHIHYNPLYMTGGEDEKDLRKWARGVLGLEKGQAVGEEMKTEFRHNLHKINPLLVLEKEWAHYYLAPRSEMLDKGWPASIFNTEDSKQPFLKEDDYHRVFGELRGHYRDWSELMRYGFYSPDHHGFLPTTVHFPDMAYFLNNPNVPDWLGRAWIDHDDALNDETSGMYKETKGFFATKGRTMKEMQSLADMLWSAALGVPHEEYPPSVDWMDEDREGGFETDESTKMKWFAIRDMLKRRSSDPETSKEALQAVLPRRNRTQLNQWGFGTGCNACDGAGYLSVPHFLERAPAFIDFRDENDEWSKVPLDRDGNPLRKIGNQYQMNDPKVHQFLRDHARSHSHPNWEDHPVHDKDDPFWRKDIDIQCPGCKGTHVCPSCHGHTGHHVPTSARMAIQNVINALFGEYKLAFGRQIKHPVTEDGVPEIFTNQQAAEANLMSDEVLGDYQKMDSRKAPLSYPSLVNYTWRPEGKRPPDEDERKEQAQGGGSGYLWVEEKDDEGESTGYVIAIKDPWFSNSGGRGFGSAHNRQLQRVTKEEFFEGLSEEEWYAREDEKEAESAKRADLLDWAEGAQKIRERARAMADEPFRGTNIPLHIEDINAADETLKPSQCVFPGCEQRIPHGQKYCAAKEMRPHVTVGANGRKFMEMVPTGMAAPDHHGTVNSENYLNAINSAIPTKNYYGGHEPIEKMIGLGFRLEASKRFGTRHDINPERHKEFIASDFAKVLAEHGYIEGGQEGRELNTVLQELRGRNREYNSLQRRLTHSAKSLRISPKEYKKIMQGPKPPLNDQEYEAAVEKRRQDWFDVTKDAVAAWQNTIDKIDMHVPYFTHPDYPANPSLPRKVFTPFDVFGSGGVPEDSPMFDYIPHGLDPDNPNHKTSYRPPEGVSGMLGLRGVNTPPICPMCWSQVSKEEMENEKCSTCGRKLTKDMVDRSMFEPGYSYTGAQTSGSPVPPEDFRKYVHSEKAAWLGHALDARKRLNLRIEFIVDPKKFQAESGMFDPALIRCRECNSTGVVRDQKGNAVKCTNCIELPVHGEKGHPYSHVTMDFDKDAIIQFHRPNYRVMRGDPMDPGSWKEVGKEGMDDAIRALRLGAGGSKLNERLKFSEVEERLHSLQHGEFEHLDEEIDTDEADKAEHYARTLLQIDHDGKHHDVLIPTLHPGFLSNNAWNNSRGGSPHAKFRGHESAASAATNKVNKHWHSAGGDLLMRELLRLTGVRDLSELGSMGMGGGVDRELPTWKAKPKLKSIRTQTAKALKKLQKKKVLTDSDEAALNDGLALQRLIGKPGKNGWIDGVGNPIALISKMSGGGEVYMLSPKLGKDGREQSGMVRDVQESILRGAFFTRADGKTIVQQAAELSAENLNHNDNRHFWEPGVGYFGTAGLEYVDAMKKLDRGIEGYFHYGGKDWVPRQGHDQPAHWQAPGKLTKSAIFTPAALHDEAHQAVREGRHEHAAQYMDAIGSNLEGTGIPRPQIIDEEVAEKSPKPVWGRGMRGFSDEGSWEPRPGGGWQLVQPGGPKQVYLEGGGKPVMSDTGEEVDDNINLSEDPVDIAWSIILKNIMAS